MVNIMSTPLFDDLPASLKSVQTRPLFVIRLDVKPIVIVGETPGAFRRVGIVPSGTFAGERMSGKVLDGGADWQTVRSDASTTLDVRLILQTDDGVNITMAYRGVRHGPADVIARVEEYSGLKLAEAYALPKLDQEVKRHTKYARQNGIHVSPTFMIDGLVQNDMSSGDAVSAWVSRLSAN